MGKFPPYGLLHKNFQAVVSANATRVSPAPHTSWNDHLNGLISGIETHIWPRWNFATGTWAGALTPTYIEALTRADLNCVQNLNRNIPDNSREWLLFIQEDRPGSRADPLAAVRQDARLPPAFINNLAINTIALKPYIAGSKFLFQRPRPAQMALILSIPITVLYAESSLSPSLVSGHGLEGIAGVCNAFTATRAGLSAANTTAAKEWAVGIGDRRVFAGVHYPSDNFASWYVASQIAPFIWTTPGDAAAAKAFMWEAISQHSLVYAETANHTEFTAPRAWLENAFN